jgi:hypothetical protein
MIFGKKLSLLFKNNFKRNNHCKFIHHKSYLKPFLSNLPCIVCRESFSIIFNVKKRILYSIKYSKLRQYQRSRLFLDLTRMESLLLKDDSVFKKHIDAAKTSLTGTKAEQYKKLTTRQAFRAYSNKHSSLVQTFVIFFITLCQGNNP